MLLAAKVAAGAEEISISHGAGMLVEMDGWIARRHAIANADPRTETFLGAKIASLNRPRRRLYLDPTCAHFRQSRHPSDQRALHDTPGGTFPAITNAEHPQRQLVPQLRAEREHAL